MISPVSTVPLSSPRSLSASAPPRRRNHFHALFEQRPLKEDTPLANPKPGVARTRSAFSPPGAEVRSSRTDRPPEQTTRSAAAVTARPAATMAAGDLPESPAELGWYVRSPVPVSLEPLLQAMIRAGLDPNRFQFDQVEAHLAFPHRPDLDYTTRQIVIRGPKGVGLFDRDLALRTPWVTAAELQTYGIA